MFAVEMVEELPVVTALVMSYNSNDEMLPV